MKIEKITLKNFGSYEGVAEFDLSGNSEKNIILIGGKNGAGKTTLFTAMRLCLYGYMSMGYKNFNSYYTRAIVKIINNIAKMNKPVTSSVALSLRIKNGRDIDFYELKREWEYHDSLSETFEVYKNYQKLSTEETYDFEKYIMNLVPPELFNLYFFDGEKIADFFLEDGGNIRIKNAFLTLCGYDTFEIMAKQFRRMNTANSGANPQVLEYIKLKKDISNAQEKLDSCKIELEKCLEDIDNCSAEIKNLDTLYEKNGGVTEEYWNAKLAALKEEERKRDNLNALIRKEANDTIPFLMIHSVLEKLRDQILEEEENRKFQNFVEVLNHPAIKSIFNERKILEDVYQKGEELFSKGGESILDLSLEEKSIVISQINKIINYDKNVIITAKNKIRSSIKKSAKIRAELENSSVESVKMYMTKKNELLEEKAALLSKQIDLDNDVRVYEENLLHLENEISKCRKELEDELKKKSINDISSKAVLMLEKLQGILYHNQIKKVEEHFRKEINLLMRKTRFIDDINIDDDFNIHLYRYEEIDTAILIKLLRYETNSITDVCMSYLKERFNCSTIKDIIQSLEKCSETTIVPMEIDKTLFSNGEKQIFIMALYHSLVQLSNSEVPFVIDTPFARIDTEHRNNISKYFFSRLNGQVFILSTNEEIGDVHIGLMKDKIAHTYTLENADNKKTTIINGTYFEVK